MNLEGKTRKDIGYMGEEVAAQFLKRHGFTIVDRNVVRKTGELDLVARKGSTLHFIEVKTHLRREFPDLNSPRDDYDPSDNLHPYKIRKVARTAEWYVAEKEWEGEWQLDGVLVWLRERDCASCVEYLPQIV